MKKYLAISLGLLVSTYTNSQVNQNNPTTVDYDLKKHITSGTTSGHLRKSFVFSDDGTGFLYSKDTDDGNALFQTILYPKNAKTTVLKSYTQNGLIPSFALSKQENKGCMLYGGYGTASGVNYHIFSLSSDGQYYNWRAAARPAAVYKDTTFQVTPDGSQYGIFYQQYDYLTGKRTYNVSYDQYHFYDCANLKFGITERQVEILDFAKAREKIGYESDLLNISSAFINNRTTATIAKFRELRPIYKTKTWLIVTDLITNAKQYTLIEQTQYYPNSTVSKGIKIKAHDKGFVVAFSLHSVKNATNAVKVQFWNLKNQVASLTKEKSITALPQFDPLAHCKEKPVLNNGYFDQFDLDTNQSGETVVVLTNSGDFPILQNYLFNRNGELILDRTQNVYTAEENQSCFGTAHWDYQELYPVAAINNSGQFAVLTQQYWWLTPPKSGVNLMQSKGKVRLRVYQYK